MPASLPPSPRALSVLIKPKLCGQAGAAERDDERLGHNFHGKQNVLCQGVVWLEGAARAAEVFFNLSISSKKDLGGARPSVRLDVDGLVPFGERI